MNDERGGITLCQQKYSCLYSVLEIFYMRLKDRDREMKRDCHIDP